MHLRAEKKLISGHHPSEFGELRLSAPWCKQPLLHCLGSQSNSVPGCKQPPHEPWVSVSAPQALWGAPRQMEEGCRGWLPLSSFPCLLPCSWSIYQLHSQVPQQQQHDTGGGKHKTGHSSTASVVWRIVHKSSTLPLPVSLHRLGKRMRLQLWNLGGFPLSL